MIEGLLDWYRSKTVREKRLLLVAVALFVFVLSWLAIIRPLGLALDSAKERHDRAVIERAEIEAQLQAITTVQRENRAARTGPIRNIVDSELARAGFEVSQTEAVGADGVRIIISAVRPQAFFAWVGDLEMRLGLDVEALTARPNSDETLAVDMTLRNGR